MDYIAHPLGARVRVKVIKHDVIIGKIIVPVFKDELPSAGDPANETMKGPETLQLVEIMEVGEGQFDNTTGNYRGSRFKVGDKCLMRCGPHSQVHMDKLPGKTEFIVLEATLAASVEFVGAETRELAVVA